MPEQGEAIGGYDLRLYRAGVAARNEGQPQQAIAFLRAAIREAPFVADYQLALAEVAFSIDDLGLTAGAACRAAAMEPGSAAAYFLLGLAARALKRPVRACEFLWRAVASNPGHGPARLALANLLVSCGLVDAAIPHFRAAARMVPGDTSSWNQLGNALRRLGRTEEARAAYVEALRRDPGLGAVWGNLGACLVDLGNLDGARSALEEATRLAPNDLSAWNNRGLLMRRQGEFEVARQCFTFALALDPGYAPALSNLGLTACDQGRFGAAVAVQSRAVRLEPALARAWNNLGQALRASGESIRAEKAWRSAVALDPLCAQAIASLGAVDVARENFASAAWQARRALRLAPTSLDLVGAYAHVMVEQGRIGEALRACRVGLAMAPHAPDLLCHRGMAEEKRGADGGIWYDRARRLVPQHSVATMNWGISALRVGDLDEGWDAYRKRFDAGRARPNRRFAIPEWDGQPLPVKRLLIWREQGVGDEFLFASCYADALKRAPNTVIEADRRLVTLFQRSFPDALVRAQRPDAGEGRLELVDCDVHIPAASLPGLIDRGLSAFATRRVSWIVPHAGRTEEWEDTLQRLGPGLRVGISWRSQLMSFGRRSAYLPLDRWKAVFEVPGLVFVNLQYDECADELSDAEERYGRRIHNWPWMDLRNDFEGLAALIANLDVVITPANSVGELAGAIGVPVWRFAFRDWTQLGTAVRPWYRSMRLFQPVAGERMDGTMARIAAELVRASGLTPGFAGRTQQDHRRDGRF